MEKIVKKVILISYSILCFICIGCINFASATESELEYEIATESEAECIEEIIIEEEPESEQEYEIATESEIEHISELGADSDNTCEITKKIIVMKII